MYKMALGITDFLKFLHTGELNLGEPCAPYTITRVRQGTQQVQELIDGRKVPLLDIRKQALKDHFPFMRLQKQGTGDHSRSGTARKAGRARVKTHVR